MLTVSEENHLKAIFKISERNGTPVSTNKIAHELNTAAASVTDMLKRLSAKKLIKYEKYQGAHLTEQGNQLATRLVRKHRLWETFLVEKLEFSWDEVHQIAEQLEHIQSETLTERLDAFLDYPRFDPHGDPIPDRNGKFTLRKQHVLDSLEQGDTGIIIGVSNHDTDFLKLLDELQVKLGVTISILSKFDYDDSLKVRIGESAEHIIPKNISKNIYVKKA